MKEVIFENTKLSKDIEQWKGEGTILVADDEEMLRLLLKDVLEETGFKVIQACDGEEALEIYKKRHEEIGLCILDIVMPVILGVELVTQFHEISKKPIILMSGYEIHESKVINECLGTMKKPIRLKNLLQMIRYFMTEK